MQVLGKHVIIELGLGFTANRFGPIGCRFDLAQEFSDLMYLGYLRNV